VLTALQYGEWIAWEIGTEREMGTARTRLLT